MYKMKVLCRQSRWNGKQKQSVFVSASSIPICGFSLSERSVLILFYILGTICPQGQLQETLI
ncbi:hypothetical protein TMatcc_007047 [Talaromyces marneffei ATCC 18224]